MVINPKQTIKAQHQQNTNQYQLQQKYKEYFTKAEDIKSKQYQQLRTKENKFESQKNNDYLPQNQLITKIEDSKNNYRRYDYRKQQSQKNFVNLDINANINENEDNIKIEKINKNINKIRDRGKYESQKIFVNILINTSLDDDNLNGKINKSIKQSKNNEYKNKTSSKISLKKLEESRENNKDNRTKKL